MTTAITRAASAVYGDTNPDKADIIVLLNEMLALSPGPYVLTNIAGGAQAFTADCPLARADIESTPSLMIFTPNVAPDPGAETNVTLAIDDDTSTPNLLRTASDQPVTAGMMDSGRPYLLVSSLLSASKYAVLASLDERGRIATLETSDTSNTADIAAIKDIVVGVSLPDGAEVEGVRDVLKVMTSDVRDHSYTESDAFYLDAGLSGFVVQRTASDSILDLSYLPVKFEGKFIFSNASSGTTCYVYCGDDSDNTFLGQLSGTRYLQLGHGLWTVTRDISDRFIVQGPSSPVVAAPASDVRNIVRANMGQSLSVNMREAGTSSWQALLQNLSHGYDAHILDTGAGSTSLMKSNDGGSGHWWDNETGAPGDMLTDWITKVTAAQTATEPLPTAIDFIIGQRDAGWIAATDALGASNASGRTATMTVDMVRDAIRNIVSHVEAEFAAYAGTPPVWRLWPLGGDRGASYTSAEQGMFNAGLIAACLEDDGTNDTNVVMGPPYYDVALRHDQVHPDHAGYVKMGQRMALADARDHFSVSGQYQGPPVASYSWSGAAITITFTPDTGSKIIAPPSGMADNLHILPNTAATNADVPVTYEIDSVSTSGVIVLTASSDVSATHVPVIGWGKQDHPARGRMIMDQDTALPAIHYDPRPISVNHIDNSSFATDDEWAMTNADAEISSLKLKKLDGSSVFARQTLRTPLDNGEAYRLTMVVSALTGSPTARFRLRGASSNTLLTSRTTTGTFTEEYTATEEITGADVSFSGSGTMDVSYVKIERI